MERIWPGSTIVCLATGPSLTLEDCDAVRGKSHVIAINDAHRLAPWADVLYSSDRIWWPRHQAVPGFAGLRYGIGAAVGFANPFARHPEIVVLKNTGYTGIETDPSGLRNGRNSGYAAINLAVHLGAARIILLGYDMRERDGKTHFFGEHVGMNNPTDAMLEGFRSKFRTMVEPLQQLGVSALNCTRRTALDAFPVAALEDVLAMEAAA